MSRFTATDAIMVGILAGLFAYWLWEPETVVPLETVEPEPDAPAPKKEKAKSRFQFGPPVDMYMRH